MKAAARQSAMRTLMDWVSKITVIYNAHDGQWQGSSRPLDKTPTLNHPEYMSLRNSADISIKSSFEASQHVQFDDFAKWIEKALVHTNKGEPFPFNEFYERRDKLVGQLSGTIWD